MSFQETLTAIQQSPLFRQFEPEQRVELARHGKVRHYVRNQHIFHSHEAGDQFYLIIKGDVLISLNDGRFTNLAAGRLFGEIAALTGHERHGAATASSDEACIIEFNFKQLTAELDPATAMKLFSVLTRKIANYLTPQESEQLIRNGEGPKVEFKESFSRELRNKCIAAMVAFMNTHGGVLFIGVKDSGEVQGLDLKEKTMDNYQLDILNRFKQKTNKEYAPLISFREEVIDDKLILRVDCKPSHKPVFLIDGEQEIYIARTASQNTFYFKPSEYIPVILDRFRETDLNALAAE